MDSLRDRLEQRLQRHWYRPGSRLLLLRPLSWCYGRIAAQRREKFLAQADQHYFPEPIVVIGNISLGGTGKSPVVAALVRLLQSQDYRPAVLLRGYGGEAADYPHLVQSEDSPALVGDEALMLKLALDCPVLVDPDRVRGAKALIQKENPDIILCDDGLQHYALRRDLEIVVIDGSRGLGNGLLLPAGPLREPVSRLDSVDLVLCNGTADQLDAQLRQRVDYAFQLRPKSWRHLASGERFAIEARPFGQQIHAVAGIGNPERFFQSLEQLGLQLERHRKPDHFAFCKEDLPTDGKPLVMTDKDAVKCRSFAAANWWVLEVEAELPQALCEDFMQRCEQLMSRSAE